MFRFLVVSFLGLSALHAQVYCMTESTNPKSTEPGYFEFQYNDLHSVGFKLLRAEGRAEPIADIRLVCSGGASGSSNSVVGVHLSAPVALPLAGVSLIIGNGQHPTVYLPTLVEERYVGFQNVSAPVGAFIARITGIRVDVSENSNPALTAHPAQVTAQVATYGGIAIAGPEVIVGYPVPSLQFQLLDASGSPTNKLTPSPSASALTHSVLFRETIPAGFQIESWLLTYTQSTRLVAQFSNLPPGATIAVSAASLAGPSARLVTTESGAYSPVPLNPEYVALPVAGNAAKATWELLSASPLEIEAVRFGLIVSGSAQTANVIGRYGPADSVSLPRFRDSAAPSPENCTSACIHVPSTLTYTHRFGAPRPPATPFPIAFDGAPVTVSYQSFATHPVPWFAVNNGQAQWMPEALPPGRHVSFLAVQPAGGPVQYVRLLLSVTPPQYFPPLPSTNTPTPPPLCEVSSDGVPITGRSTSVAESTAGLVLYCRAAPGTVVNSTLSVQFNAPVTSARIPGGNSTLLESLLFVEGNPQPFAGFLNGERGIRFPNVSFNVPSGGVRLRVVNLRLDLSKLGVSSSIFPTRASATIGFSGSSPAIPQAQQDVAYVLNPFTFSAAPAALPVVSDPSIASPINVGSELTFTEAYASNFRKRNAATTPSAPFALMDQSEQGLAYYTETMLYEGARGLHGLATQSTRLRAVITGIPAGVTIYATNSALNSSSSTLVAKRITTNPDGAGVYAETPATVVMRLNAVDYPASVVPVVNGTAVAVWEVLASDPFSYDTARFGIAARHTGVGPVAPLSQISATLAPLDDGVSLPRFTAEPARSPACTAMDCVSAPPQIVIRRSPSGNITQSTPLALSTNGLPVLFTATANQPWLRLNPLIVNAPATIDLSLSPEALSFAPGEYLAQLSNGTTVRYIVESAAPSVDSTPPSYTQGTSGAYTFEFSHPAGYAQLGVVNVLINSSLNGAAACYVAFSQPANVLYLVNDAGPANGLSGPLTLGGAGQVSNSQCSVTGAGSSVTRTGNILRLVLNISFQPAFAGHRVLYLAARTTSEQSSGWQTKGAVRIPGSVVADPEVGPLSPSAGSTTDSTLTFSYAATSPLETVWGLINSAVNGAGACYFAYYVPANLLLLIPDSGDGAQAISMPLTGSGSLENSQCRIAAAGSSATLSGNNLTLTLKTTFQPAFAGGKGIWAAGKPLGTAPASPWRIVGAWTVPGY